MSLNQRLIRTNDTGGGGNISPNLVIGLDNGYIYGANGLVKPDASETRPINVIYHPIVNKHYYSVESDDSERTNIYESSDGGATWSSINLPAFSTGGFGTRPNYNPQTQKVYFGYTKNATFYVYSIDNTGTIGYNTISNFHPGSSFVFSFTDFSYGVVTLNTSQSNGGSYFFPISGLDGSGSSISLNTSMRLIGLNRVYGQGINWDTGHYKTWSDNNDTHYYTTTGSFIAQSYTEAVIPYSNSMTFENGFWFYVGQSDRTKLYRGTVVNSVSSVVLDIPSASLSAVRYNPNNSKYYVYDSAGDVRSSSDGLSWSVEFNLGQSPTRLFAGSFANFI